MENELMMSKDYYILSIEIFKTLALDRQRRPIPAKEYLDKKYWAYVKLYENSNLLDKRLIDKLNPLPIDIPPSKPPTPTPTPHFGLELHQLSDMPIV